MKYTTLTFVLCVVWCVRVVYSYIVYNPVCACARVRVAGTLENLFRGSAPPYTPAFPISEYSKVHIRLTHTPMYVHLNAKL